MKLNPTRAALLAAALLALPATLLAQTEQQRLAEAMQMQRAAFAQDSAGNLDQAIAIYREIAGPRTADRALAAEAQYRLSQALLQKGDLPGATEAMVQLSAGFPDQAEQISRLTSLTIEAAANEENHLYGSIGPAEVSKTLKGKNLMVEPDMVKLEHPIKEANTLTEVVLALGHGIEAKIQVLVVALQQGAKK